MPYADMLEFWFEFIHVYSQHLIKISNTNFLSQ